MMTRRRLTAVVVTATLACWPITASAAHSKLAGSRCWSAAPLSRTPGWSRIDWPAFPAKGSSATEQIQGGIFGSPSLAADPLDPSVLVASDGNSVVRSTDGGCHWSVSLNGYKDQLLLGWRIIQIRFAHAPHGPSEVYLALINRLSPDVYPDSPQFGLLRSDNDARTFQRADAGLVGNDIASAGTEAARLSVAPSDPRTLYAYFPNGEGLWGSRDAGNTWKFLHPVLATDALSNSPIDAQHQKNFTCCVVDPSKPTVVWGTTSYGVVESEDGGSTFRAIYSDRQPTAADLLTHSEQAIVNDQLSVWHRPGRAAVIRFERTQGQTWWGSLDGGKRFRDLLHKRPLSFDVLSAAASTGSESLVFGTYHNQNFLVAIDERKRSAHVRDVSGGWYSRYRRSTCAQTADGVVLFVAEDPYSGGTGYIERRAFHLPTAECG